MVSFHVTVANYEYLVYWRFYQDGNIECEVRATGILVTSHTGAPGSRPPTGRWWTTASTRRSTSTSSWPGSTSTWTGRQHRLRHRFPGGGGRRPRRPVRAGPGGPEHAAAHRAGGKQVYDWGTQRGWKVVNNNVPNGLGTPVGYKLVPSASFPPLLDPASPAYQRAEVIGHTLWVTPTVRTSAGPAAISRSRASTTRAWPRGRGPTGRSRTPTWCCGTCSASTTSPGRRTGR